MNISQIFETMDYGKAPEANEEAMKWIASHKGRFGHFINGAFTKPEDLFLTINPATTEELAQISQASAKSVSAAVKAAVAAQSGWEALGGHGRAKVLYAIARLLQKQSRLFATLETLDNGKPIRESRDIDIPLAQRHFYYHAGMAQLMEKSLPDRQAVGICGQIIPWNFPILMLAWKIAPALAMGNTVVLKPAEYTSLSALLFAEICQQAGVPKGVVNIVTGDGRVGELIVSEPNIDKIAFTGSTEVGRKIREATAGTGKSLTLELGGKSPFIVFDDADLDSAVEGVVDAIWLNQGQVCCAGSRLLVQEGVADKFLNKIKTRMKTLRVGDPMDKSIDIGAIVDPVQKSRISQMLSDNPAGEMFQSCESIPDTGCYFPPTLISGLGTSDILMQEEIFGPVLVTTTFRTPDEAAKLANDTRYGLAASIWSENVNLCLGLAPKIKAGVIWINGTNMFDASAGFGGMRESGFGREGGWEGLEAYTKPRAKTLKKLEPIVGHCGTNDGIAGLDRTAKLYIGGKQSRPDSGYSNPVFDASSNFMGHVPQANRKDIRNALEAADTAASWSATHGHMRAQILYYIAENLSARGEEFAKSINQMTGRKNGRKEVEASIDRLFTYAAWADKFDGDVRNVPMRGLALKLNEPVGKIGVICPDDWPLLGLVSTMAAGLSMGNRMIMVASEPYPFVATEFYQILDTSDVPNGVVSILTGAHGELCDTLAKHMNLDAIWSFSSKDLSKVIETGAALNLKRAWVNYGVDRDWMGEAGEGKEFLDAATEVKTVWIPFGEG
ncbi:MAG: aldehyde dehydrogenase family protein [Proteobacteria bacterium]|nr:aldehyde dehydrogenase family protein [Pseudomonadota bacterium]MDA0850449.1 aldehyde dehydrogenase family protein [Pseudomonadota bacterium]MDA1293231.1 aldehyde dehydrogenase family protein [Pseudomonadota bacterium]